ncbi:MAG: hypothetical protein JWP57_4455 [Spirosoma sp.]|nr:hypothetical protein [Spirosoma sp.]
MRNSREYALSGAGVNIPVGTFRRAAVERRLDRLDDEWTDRSPYCWSAGWLQSPLVRHRTFNSARAEHGSLERRQGS